MPPKSLSLIGNPASYQMKTTIYTLLLAIGTLYTLQAQHNPMIDSLEIVLDTITDEKQRVNTLNELAQEYNTSDSAMTAKYTSEAITLAQKIGYKSGEAHAITKMAWAVAMISGDYDKSKEMLYRALELAEEANDESAIGTALNGMGAISYYNNNYEKAADYFKQSLKLKEKAGKKVDIAGAYNNIGVIYEEWGRYPEAMESYLMALEYFEQAGDKNGISNCYNNIGIIHRHEEEYDIALNYYLKSLELMQELGYKDRLVSCHNNVGTAYTDLENYDSAQVHYEQSLAISQEMGSKDGIGFGYISLAINNHLKENYELALDYALKSYAIRQELGRKKLISQSALWLGKAYFELGQNNNARKYLKESLAIASEIEQKEIMTSAHEELADLYYRLGNHKLAYEHYVGFHELQDEINDIDKSRKLAHVEAEYEFHQTRDSMQFANEKEKMILNQQIAQQQMDMNVYIIGIAVLTIAVFVLILFSQVRNRTSKKLSALNSEIERQNRSLLDLNREKNELLGIVAHDLRNPLNQIKGMINLHIRDNKPKIDNEYLDIASEATDRLTDMVGRILDVSAIENKKIDLRIEQIDVIALMSQISINFSTILHHKDQKIKNQFPQEKLFIEADRNYLIQVIENLVGNANKYSEPNTTITLSVTSMQDHVYITVEDQGPGISKADQESLFKEYSTASTQTTAGEQSHGLGLAIVRKYVEAMKGSIAVESEIGKGSRFSISFRKVRIFSEVNNN